MECTLEDCANRVDDGAVAFDTLNAAAHQWMEYILDDSANRVDDGAVAFDTLNTATHQWMECILDDSANGVNDAAVAFDTLNTAAHQWMECTLDDCADGVDGVLCWEVLRQDVPLSPWTQTLILFKAIVLFSFQTYCYCRSLPYS